MKELFYIGGYSNSIKVCSFENENLKLINEIPCLENPSYLNINKNILYSVSETETGGISAFEILKDGTQLKSLDNIQINQSLPCYISTNMERTLIIVANYGSGSICMYELMKNGKIGKNIINKTYENGHMHFAEFVDNSIYGIDLGNSIIHTYNSDMLPKCDLFVGNGSGPRHAVFLGEYMYIITELSNKVLVYKKKNLSFELIQELSTLENPNSTSYGGAIKMSSNKNNIYVTNRGENTISVFSIENTKLKLIQTISCFGDFPRDITFNKTEEYVIVANQKSNNLSLFKRDLTMGTLTKINNKDVFIEKPSCIIRSSYEI